jgi:hypothetical protein
MRSNKKSPGCHERPGLSALFVAPAQTIEKVLHRHVERQRKLIERASRYAIGGPLVFLELLERNAERVDKHDLCHARFQATQAQPTWRSTPLGRRSDINSNQRSDVAYRRQI